MRVLQFLSLLLVVIAVTADHEEGHHNHEDPILSKFDLFALKTFQHMGTGSTKNLMYSPYAMKNMLFSIMLASDGDTYKELFQLMGIPNEEDRDHYTAEWEKIYKLIEEDNVINLKLKYFLDNAQTFTKTYADLLEKTMNAHWTHADTHDAAKLTTSINEWFHEMSKGKAQLNHPLTGERQSMVVSGMRVNGIFKYKIQETDTKKGDFYVTETEKHEDDFFTLTANMHGGFCHHLDADVAMVPFTKTGFWFVAIVPTKRTGMQTLMDNIHRVDIPGYRNIMPVKKIKLTMPRFKIVSEVLLNQYMKDLGLEHMFHEDELTHFTEGDNSLKVPDMLNRVSMAVDEHGAMTMKDDTHEHQGPDATVKADGETTIINANHPFAFAIVNEYGRIFTLGRVMDPTH